MRLVGWAPSVSFSVDLILYRLFTTRGKTTQKQVTVTLGSQKELL